LAVDKVRITRSLLMESFFWLALCGSFLAVYVSRYSAPIDSVVPHIATVGAFVLIFWSIRLTFCISIKSTFFARTIDVLFFTLLFVTLVVYYIAVIIGLESWGRVVTLSLFKVYVTQASLFLDVLSISATLVLLSAISLLGVATIVAFFFTRSFRWTPEVAECIRPSRFRIIVPVGLLLVCAALQFKWLAAPWVTEREPISLTLFPIGDATGLQNHTFSSVKTAERASIEASARRNLTATAATKRPNVVLIVVDALRSDRLSTNGYARDTTPFLKEYARRSNSLILPSVYSVCAESFCGMLGIASSRHIHQFVPNPITLQEVLGANGYKRHFLLSGDHTTFYGLKETYGPVDTYVDAISSPDKYANDDQFVIEQINNFKPFDGTPAMFQFHLMSAHVLGKRLPNFAKFTPTENYATPKFGKRENRTRLEAHNNHYDNGVAQADAMIKLIIAALESKGYLDRSIILVTGDHGEMLGEHGLWGHANTTREPVLKVPGLFFLHGIAPPSELKYDRLYSQIDFAPTILDIAGVPIPATWRGSSIFKNNQSDIQFQQGWEVGIVSRLSESEILKYVLDMKSGDEQVFNVKTDVYEAKDIASTIDQSLLANWRKRVSLSVVGQ
jgi:glucan phosphoethanolaminetransferase (alkaline phosphatase superfamily)